MSSLRRPPIEFLFVSLFFLFSLFFRVCHSKPSFYWAGDPRPQEYRPRRRCEAGPAAPKPMAPGNGVTFLWRHAVDRRFGAAVDNTRTGVVIPSPRPSFGHSRSRVSLVSELLRMVSLGCGHRRAAERSGLYQTQPLNLLLGAPRRAINLYGFGLGSRTWVWCLPARSRSL